MGGVAVGVGVGVSGFANTVSFAQNAELTLKARNAGMKSHVRYHFIFFII